MLVNKVYIKYLSCFGLLLRNDIATDLKSVTIWSKNVRTLLDTSVVIPGGTKRNELMLLDLLSHSVQHDRKKVVTTLRICAFSLLIPGTIFSRHTFGTFPHEELARNKCDCRGGHKIGQRLPIYNPRYSLDRQSQEMRPRHAQLMPSLQSCIGFKQVSSNILFDYVFFGGHWHNYALMLSIRDRTLFHLRSDIWPMTVNIVMRGAKVKM